MSMSAFISYISLTASIFQYVHSYFQVVKKLINYMVFWIMIPCSDFVGSNYNIQAKLDAVYIQS